MRIADDVAADGIDAEKVPRWHVNALLWSKDPRYSAAVEMTAGMINSYILVEEQASFLFKRVSAAVRPVRALPGRPDQAWR